MMIFRGNGGRELLNQVLTQRGAAIQTIESYQRILPNINIDEQLKKIRETPIDALIITSLESLKHFLALVGPEIEWFKKIPTIVVGRRMHNLINQLEFKRTVMATGADDASILTVLTQQKGW
jgi:uroporphyrinogen-III synthase